MNHWTDTARRTLEEYCQRTRDNLRGSGADVEEVVDDLRRHIDEEGRATQLSTVTEEDVRRILGRIGETSMQRDPELREKRLGYGGRSFLFVAFIFGVLLPAGTLALEMSTG